MSVLLECRKVNDTYIPLYFKFSTIPTKSNLTSDKYMSLEHWMNIFDELNPLLASGNDPSSYKKNKSFDVDSGRLTVKTRWIKISDVSDKGSHILKVLNLSSTTNVGKYFLRIDVKLCSYLERIVAELEQKGKSLEGKSKTKESSQDVPSSAKHKKNSHRKISDMLPKIKKENHDSSTILCHTVLNDTLSNDAVACNGLDYSNAEDLSYHEEYIPEPSFLAEYTPAYNPSSGQIDRNPRRSEYSPTFSKTDESIEEIAKYEPSTATSPTPTYNPENNLSQIEMNQIKSEYSPTSMTAEKAEPIVYKPTTKRNKSAESDKSNKLTDKKNKSRELFGSSDENYDVDDDDDRDIVAKVSSSSSHKSKRKKNSSPRREKKSSKDKSRSKKKKVHDVQMLQSSQDTSMDVGDISLRNLMNVDIDDILETYAEHEQYLTGLYKKHITQVKRNYKPKDIPDMAALDIVSNDQFQAMVDFLEEKLVRDAEEEHNYSDIIFDLLIPEWAFGIFCTKFQCSRHEALERLRLQSIAMSNCSQL